jgi:hypothetical protein
MGSRFLKRFERFCSTNARVQECELVHPINKSIKASQIYLDAGKSIDFNDDYERLLLTQPKSKHSIILQPLKARLEVFASNSREIAHDKPLRLRRNLRHLSMDGEVHISLPDKLEKLKSSHFPSPRNIYLSTNHIHDSQ